MTRKGSESPDPYKLCFQTLIGHEQKREDLRWLMGHFIDDTRVEGQDPYQMLLRTCRSALTAAAEHAEAQIDGLDRTRFAEKIRVNSKSVGLAISGLVTVGRIYEARAEVTQRHETVSGSARSAVSYLHRIAFGDQLTAIANLGALHLARDPRSPVLAAIGEPKELSEQIHDDAFVATADEQGQVAVEPRYPLLQDSGKVRCPASYDMMEVDGETRNSLLTFLNVVADTTVEHIYPHQFPMLPPEAP